MNHDVSFHPVSFGNVGERDRNTVVLAGVDLVLPLELDLDGDPLHDDEVRLRASNRRQEWILCVSDPDVDLSLDDGIARYRFRAVPRGVYEVAIRVAERWIDVALDLVVCARGVYLGDVELT